MLCCKKTDVKRDKLLIVEAEYRAGMLAQSVKVLSIKPHNQSSSLGSSMGEGKNRALKVVLWHILVYPPVQNGLIHVQ